MKKILAIIILAAFTMSIVASCADPRKNCNHPKHWQYVKNKHNKRLKKGGL